MLILSGFKNINKSCNFKIKKYQNKKMRNNSA